MISSFTTVLHVTVCLVVCDALHEYLAITILRHNLHGHS